MADNFAMVVRTCQVCRRVVPINEWDYGVCADCRHLAGVGFEDEPSTPNTISASSDDA